MNLFSLFSKQIIYVQVLKNQFILKSINSSKIVTMKAEVPFSTQRLLIGQFSIAEKLLRLGVEEVLDRKFIFAPKMIIHPLEYVEEGLSEVEEKVLIECGLTTGAQNVKIWVGDVLTDDKVVSYFE